jgi:hypothetical protein
MLLVLLLVALLVVHAGYGFRRTGTALGCLNLKSKTLTAPGAWLSAVPGRWLANIGRQIPVPLPAAFIEGIDEQLQDLERIQRTFLAGKWGTSGYWYYYLYALLVKAPLGHWCIFALAVVASVLRGWRTLVVTDMAALLLPAGAVFLLVSGHTTWNEHTRYILPSGGFLFVAMAVALARGRACNNWLGAATVAALVLSGSSMLCHYPHMLGYFNEAAGGPARGYRHLRGSNTDWGQDFYLLKAWLQAHPEARPIILAARCGVPAEALGIDYLPLTDPCSPALPAQESLRPGWYAVSVNAIDSPESTGHCWARMAPVARIGHTIWVFHVRAPRKEAADRELLGSGAP